MTTIIQWCEYLGGVTDTPPRGFPMHITWLLFGFWWTLLTALIAMFCGQSSKFIYIDF